MKSFPSMIAILSPWTLRPSALINKPMLIFNESNNPTMTSYETCIIGCTLIIYLRDKIVVPQSLQRQIVDWYHTMLAHPGKTRTIKTIEQHFHWQTRSCDIQQFVQTSQTCQHYKRQCKNYGHLPTKIQRDTELWNEVHVNLIVP
jgi:hypothetical protein